MKIEQKRGFTLIELLVVIAIIGLLASIVLASLNSARKKSRDARRIADLKQLQNALELYSNDNGGNYPTCAGCTATAGTVVSAGLAVLATSGFIAALPNDPLSGLNYNYRTSATANATSYCLGATIEGTPPTPAVICSTGVSLPAAQGTYQVGN